MSRFEDAYIERIEKGFDDISGYICADCVNNRYLKEWIRENSVGEYECKYCESSHPCVPISSVLEKIMDYINFYYEDVNNGTIAYDGETEEYLGDIYYYQDLMDEIIGILRAEPEDDLINDIDEALLIKDIVWCDRDPYTTSHSDALRYSWKMFSDTVKYKSRYLFFNQQQDDDFEYYSPLDILNEITSDLEQYKLYTTIPTNQSFYRCRGFKDRDDIKTNVEELVSPKSPIPSANRMSAEGISAFYGSFDGLVACREIANKTNNYIVCAEFRAKHELNCLDLTKISNMKFPDPLDIERADFLQKILFYKELYKQLTTPFQDYKNIEYVPVQVFAEYCKFVLKVDGIIYGSSKVRDGKCLVLFFDHDQCLGSNDAAFSKEPKLELMGVETYRVSVNYDFNKL